MSISLKDLERRVTVLENKSKTSGYKEEIIFGSLGKYWGSGTFKMTKRFDEFNAIRVASNRNGNVPNYYSEAVFTRDELNKFMKCGIDTDQGHCQLTFQSDKQTFSVHLGEPDWLYMIFGITWGGYKLLKTLKNNLFKFNEKLFKEVII